MDLSKYSVTVARGQTFTGEETSKLFALIHKRFGSNIETTTVAIRRLLQNSADEQTVEELVKEGLAQLG